MENSEECELLFQKLESFCRINEQFCIAFKATEKSAALSRRDKNDLHLHYLARNILPSPQYFQETISFFPGLLPKILSITINFDDKSNRFNNHQHIINCVLLGKLIAVRPDLGWYACKYFEENPSPFIEEEIVQRKRSKMQKSFTITDLELVESIYLLLKSNLNFYKNKWEWSHFFEKFLNNQDLKVRWISSHCAALVFGMNEAQLKQLVSSKMSLEVYEELSCSYNFLSTLNKNENIPPQSLDQNPCIAINKRAHDEVVEVGGIYIPKLAAQQIPNDNLVMVDSTYNNLRKIALGLTSNKAICLQGPVGSGKTTLIEYLANKTGRKLGENFVKIQLGDQTDSKMLLGTYRCTDIPGEFVWQPGVVTQAVIEGNWLLLEDIDLASMDIASVLSSLLENGTLTVPGYRDSIAVHLGFQLFFTQRLLSTITGHHKKHSNAMTLLEKHLLQINIDPLSSQELRKILIAHHPQFATVADRMLSVFHLFSKDLSNDTNQVTLPKTSRLISTRDFFKWCLRASIDFDVSSQASALKVLQDAIDVFCCSYPKQEDALNLAKEISTHLGIINQKAEYFFKNYKPAMTLTAGNLIVGRANIPRNNDLIVMQHNFYFTRPSSVLLERIMCCVNLKEPVLLVGETGTGKTSSVQYLANTVGQKLIVINMNQQSDSADLLGGFKPVDLKFVIGPIKRQFEHVFCDFFQIEPNKKFLGHIAYCFNEHRWSDLVKLMMKSYEAAITRLTKEEVDSRSSKFLERWQDVGQKLQKLSLQLKQKSALAFAFIEGSLVKAVEEGYWVLLDEINLANAETLECLSGLLEGSEGSLCLLERGDKQPVKRNKNFTLFACMNPSTDIGKKDLPAGLRNRFTELFVDELTEKTDLLLLVGSYLNALSLKDDDLQRIVNFYLNVRKETETTLTDGLGHKPHFSLRSLCRALMIAARNPCGMFKKSLYEAFCLSFLTQLDAQSYKIVERMIARYVVGDEKTLKSIKKQSIPKPKANDSDDFIQFEGYWVRKGNLECVVPDDYILTESVRTNLKDLVRIVSIGGLPVLLQGDTSVGKTSLITYLAKSSGNKCVRINNHEHTDLQEYIGSYVADYNGKLVFREGLLVEAMRKGHWIILDELNLAPTDVLEALNRVLDDNRELFIPETQEIVKADPNFMLFATQNPPGSYGGRKMLSRAFRNRFVELHFNEIPPVELEFILHKRCQMPASYSKKMINAMTDLQVRRRGSAAFAGKQGFITLRDLFRWGERYRLAQNTEKLYDWDQHLADEGYLVLAGRVRRAEERQEIIEVLQKHLKRIVDPQNLFTLSDKTSVVTKNILATIYGNRHKFENIVWTYNMRQLAVLVAKAFQFKEPVLLVGETGGGKTTVCKLIAEQNNQQLATVNCHMHTESSDFIGGLRPVRDHVGDDVNKLFEWVDGPLIHSMVNGNMFLADEISLADDSVLERLNSLLEPERTLLLAERGADINNSNNSELIVAVPNFYFIGTMNPGGDYGKKELSPALRNRFTEIWCEACTDRNDLVAIIEQNITKGISFGNQQDGSSGMGSRIMDFVEWFTRTEIGKRLTVSIRDILTWVSFINTCTTKMDVAESYLHGACLTFLDGLGSGITGTENLKSLQIFRNKCENFLKSQIQNVSHSSIGLSMQNLAVDTIGNSFGIKPFYIEMGQDDGQPASFSFGAPTTTYNTLRLLRGMQLNKAILLEGSPGVGKTSLVTAVAKFTKNKVFRVNLSDQTDISDLFGADLPVEGGTGGQFSWRDGPLLQALKQGHWILLDELNLASQSVLEGLNACLDHRGEIYIPELGKTFHVKPGTRFFGCQNPLKQGGSRRGLPKSFLNRFIQVYVNSLTEKDFDLILRNQFPDLPTQILEKMLKFNSRIVRDLENHNFGNKGAPWEVNLRDMTRWCEAVVYHYDNNPNPEKKYQPENLVNLIYGDRLRTVSDKAKISEQFEEIFGLKTSIDGPILYVNNNKVFLGDVGLIRNQCHVDVDAIKEEKSCLVLRTQLSTLRSLAYCVNLNWMSLLVGSSASGKSTVVRALANLTGKTLRTLPVTSAMDTTDILGGFEQTDYSRCLEEIVKETEQLLFQTLRNQLVKGRSCMTLLQLWETYTNISDIDTTRTMVEEAKLFLKKLDKLEIIWTALHSVADLQNKDALQFMRNKTDKIRQSVKTEGSLNAGGKFEWVDSVLIKCLQDGSWLLIDNVNLCSAAVLDRLNALLEPQGVLTVGERGVDEAGKMVEIKPHPDFRLFLTMDPKNGEISRAMRNRGVEIYMFNDREIQSRNDYDIKSMISQAGLKNNKHINALLYLHDFVSDLIMGEQPNINELLRAATLITQQIQNGCDISKAFSDTIREVYYKTRSSMEFNCNDFEAVVATEITKCLRFPADASAFYCDELSLKTHHIQTCANLEQIRQQGFYLQQLLSQMDGNEAFDHALKYALINFYSISSIDDLNSRYLYLNNLLLQNGADNLSVVSQCLRDFIKNAPTKFKSFPLDLHWIPESNFTDRNDLRGNALMLGLHLVASLQKENYDTKKHENTTLKQISLCSYMLRRQQNKIEDQFDGVLIENFLSLIQEYDSFLLESVNTCTIDTTSVIKIIELLSWRYIFYRCTFINIKKVNGTQRYILLTNLKVHYRWFLKYSLNSVRDILRHSIPKQLAKVIKSINDSLEKQFSTLHLFSKRYQKFNKKPPPKISNEEITFETIIQDVVKYVNVCDKANNITHILDLFKQYPDLRKTLIDLKLDSETNYASKINCLKNLQEKCSSEKTDLKTGKYELQILPFTDYFLQLKVKRSLQAQDDCPAEFETSPLLPAEFAICVLLYFKTKDERLLHEVSKNLYHYLTNSACVRYGLYYELNEAESLPNFGPNLIYHTTNLLIGTNNKAVTTFGNFQALQKQHRYLNLTLWRNLPQLRDESFDYVFQERWFVIKSFEQFMEELGQSLNLSSNNLNELVQVCLRSVSVLQDYGDLSQSFVEHLNKCVEIVNKLESANGFDTEIFYIDTLRMELNYVKAILNSRLALIDPSAKKALKKKYCLENINNFEDLRDSFIIMNKVYSGNDRTLHNLYHPVVTTIENLKAKNEKLGAYVAIRPKNTLYEEVVKSVSHGFSTILSCQYINRIILGLEKSISDLLDPDNKESTNSFENLKQYYSAVSSFDNLVMEWTKYRSSYPDVIEPLLSNLSEFLYGLKCNLALLKKLVRNNERERFNLDLQRELVKLVQMPSLGYDNPRYESLIDSYTDSKFHHFIEKTLEDDDGKNRETLRLFKCGIQESFNNCIVEAKASGILNREIFSHFENLIKAFVGAWNQQEEEREIREKEADSLYKTKTKCDDKTETEQIEDELKELFPNYHDQDFSDMHQSDLSDDALVENVQKTFSGTHEITHDDVKFVAELHLMLVQGFTKTEWLNPDKNKNAVTDFVLPLIEKYKLFRKICERSIQSLDYRMDKKLTESVTILLAYVNNYGDTSNLQEHQSPSKIIHRKNYDFYKDSNVEEVKASFHILEELRLRIVELLKEWPDQPTLKTILNVIERLYNFDITSPLTRFLTGFEILLSKCNEWEEVAHSGVTLSQFSQNITHQIIAWRKTELNVWKDLLNSTFYRMNDPIYKWWLYLYNIMEQFITQDDSSEMEIIEALQNYVTRSNLAEYEDRLKLLHAFHCHAIHLKSSEKSRKLINILWNLYCYFQQFNVTVANKIKDLRAPIEKKLKDYVKIVRWKDINYWAIKETVDKSHKTLHKYVREFQDVLKQPVTQCLINTSTFNIVDNVGIWDRPQRNVVKTYHYTLDASKYVATETLKKKLNLKTSIKQKELLDKIDSCFAESRKVCKEAIQVMKYPRLIQSLDNFVTEIIETSAHLQALEVDTTLIKDKQKSHAKSILQQKHRALADLFKTLSKIGLSFKSGIVQAKLKMVTEDFLMKPIDINANFSHIHYNRKDEKILTIWDSCEMYYLKSLMRADVLDTALKAPAPDLGLQNIARCRGFSSNLLTFAQKQKAQLTECTNSFYYLRHYTNQMTKLCEAKHFLDVETVEKVQQLMKNITIVMTQSKIILNSCPEEQYLNAETPEIVMLNPVSTSCIQFKNDPLWNKSCNIITDVLNISTKICVDLEKHKGEIPSAEFRSISLKFVPIPDLNNVSTKLEDISKYITDLGNIAGNLQLSESLKWLTSEIADLIVKISNKSENFDYNKKHTNKIQKTVNAITEKVCAILQGISHKYSESTESDAVNVEETNIEEDHLRSLIVSNIGNDLELLKMKEILDLCSKISEIFFEIPPNKLEETKSIVSYILPVLEQVILLYQYFLTQQVSAYRVICKMTSVLLNIFIELASKGFCVPPELAEGDEGLSKPSDGLGLGEGEGERDVSDKIESEDQLDDAQPAGQEKQKDDDKDCKEEEKGIEMSEDFDSKLQDVDKNDEEEDEDSNSDGEEQMGDTKGDGTDLNKETFGSDEEEPEETEEKDENGEGGEQEGEAELGAKDKDESKKSDKLDKDGKEKEEQKKEINEMEDKEYDDDQTDPYHGKQPELPEPEPMDLPDDLQLDDGQANENEEPNEENPFDIDAMKEDNPLEKNEKEKGDEISNEERDDINDYSSEDEDITHKNDDADSTEEEGEDNRTENKETTKEPDPKEAEDDVEKTDDSALDQTHTNEENVEAMDVDNNEASDKTQASEANQKSNQPIEELCQEDKPDKEGVGQSQMEESSTGHTAQSSAPQDLKGSKRDRQEEFKKQLRPGDSDIERSLGDINEPVKKKLKTIDDKSKDDSEQDLEGDEESNEKQDSEMFKHIKDAKENLTQILDVATKEQVEEQKRETQNSEESDKEDEPSKSSDNLPNDEEKDEIDTADCVIKKPEETEGKKNKKNDRKQHPEGDILDEIQDVEIDGEIIETMDVARGFDTSYNTLYNELKGSTAMRLTLEEINLLRSSVEKQLSAWNEVPSDVEADRTWQKISSVTSSLAQDLSEQLRLVLEPTQASRLRGDFRTGRRINMRKVIPYIASQFRKDKIWLRRTKPSKREYQIVLAIDDSASMADNHSKELAFESVALISKALTLLESGQLSVISFGEAIEIVHKLADQFTERSGVKLLQKFQFNQNKTCVAKLVDFVTEMFEQSCMQSTALNAKLLIIVSDGRGVFSEGEGFVRQAVRRAKLSNIFMVFVIIDNPENKHSVLDIRMPTFIDGKLLGIQNYMDVFPFSFYIILRDLNSLPNVLSDALRQWFEVVSNLDKL